VPGKPVRRCWRLRVADRLALGRPVPIPLVHHLES
jgi:hypothetical protein